MTFRCPICYGADNHIDEEMASLGDTMCNDCHAMAILGLNGGLDKIRMFHKYDRKFKWARKQIKDERKAFNLIKYGPMP